MDDEAQIRNLVERWATAVHQGDLNGVIANHADDIVMFDVPPPFDGVRGIEAYRETWPPFFELRISSSPAMSASPETMRTAGHRSARGKTYESDQLAERSPVEFGSKDRCAPNRHPRT